MNLAMSRSHAWVRRGEEFVDRLPINHGRYGLTLFGAMRLSGWVVLTTGFQSATKNHFVWWLRRKLLPKLRRGDVIVMDNLSAHHDSRIAPSCAPRGVRIIYLPPYSPDFNPIESGWALQKQHVRRYAPRDASSLRRVARRARYRVTRRHARNWFEHAGYAAQHR
jgi:transposase